MPRVKKPLKEMCWYVPMTMSFRGGGYVTATTAEEAKSKAKAGDFESHNGNELYDWEVIGEPECEE